MAVYMNALLTGYLKMAVNIYGTAHVDKIQMPSGKLHSAFIAQMIFRAFLYTYGFKTGIIFGMHVVKYRNIIQIILLICTSGKK